MKQNPEISLEPDQTASDATRQILRVLLAALQAPLAGALDGLDPKPLHDFRVATRRTRSAVGQLKRALPQKAVTRFAPDFKWLGEMTGPCRDLDVWLVNLDARRHSLTDRDAVALEPLEELVRVTRGRAHAAMVRGMSSSRFQRLLEEWPIFLTEWPTPSEPPPDGDIPVKYFAERRISIAFKRVKRRGRNLGEHPEALALHQLRIAAKKLRYLFEFFRSLDHSGKIRARINDLKALQDVLGELNDLEFQRTGLSASAGELEGTATRETRVALEMLRSEIDHRRDELRQGVQRVLHPVIRRSPSACFGSLPS